jgi:hypothetical protein
MTIWGRRDSEAPDEEAQESWAEVPESQAGAQDTQESAAEHQAGGPAPAFWRAQGETQEASEAPGRDPAGTDAPVPVLTGVVVDEETGVTDPATAEAAEPATTEVQEPTVAVAREPVVTEAQESATAAAPITPQRWSEIMVAFVDDPRGSVKMAADAVDEAIDEFVNSVRARQHDLAATWQSAGADTEQLRTALREYRKLGLRVEQLDLGEKTGG